MSMEAVVEILEGDIAVVHCSGRITIGVGSGTLRDTIGDLLAAQHNKIVMDFAEVPFIDSSGFGELVRGFSDAKNAGGGLVLARPGERVTQVLRHTRLSKIIPSFESVEDAVAHLKGGQ